MKQYLQMKMATLEASMSLVVHSARSKQVIFGVGEYCFSHFKKPTFSKR
jgi:hypothetical protein